MRDGAVTTVGVHGMKGEVPEADPETGDIPSDAVQTSFYSKGDASYYHAHRRRNELPEEHRVEPRKIGENTPLPEPKAVAHAINFDGEQDSGRASRRILNYAWGDEGDDQDLHLRRHGAGRHRRRRRRPRRRDRGRLAAEMSRGSGGTWPDRLGTLEVMSSAKTGARSTDYRRAPSLQGFRSRRCWDDTRWTASVLRARSKS